MKNNEIGRRVRDCDWHCVIPGKPQPQERVKAFRAGRSVRVYDPPKSREYKKRVAEYAQKYIGPRERPLFPKGTALDVTLWVYLPCPQSWSKKKKALALEWKIYPVQNGTGDDDNFAKTVLDGLTQSGVWDDDVQAVDTHISKRYDDWPRVEVEVRTL